MDESPRLVEPLVERHDERRPHLRSRPGRKPIGPSFFTLSGGILKRDPRASNTIDAMLERMLDGPVPTCSPHVDKNLDYLHTCLQLDMISMAAMDLEPEKGDYVIDDPDQV